MRNFLTVLLTLMVIGATALATSNTAGARWGYGVYRGCGYDGWYNFGAGYGYVACGGYVPMFYYGGFYRRGYFHTPIVHRALHLGFIYRRFR